MYTLGIPDRQKRRTLGYLKQQYIEFEENPSMEGFIDVSFPGMDEDAFRNIVLKLKHILIKLRELNQLEWWRYIILKLINY